MPWIPWVRSFPSSPPPPIIVPEPQLHKSGNISNACLVCPTEQALCMAMKSESRSGIAGCMQVQKGQEEAIYYMLYSICQWKIGNALTLLPTDSKSEQLAIVDLSISIFRLEYFEYSSPGSRFCRGGLKTL